MKHFKSNKECTSSLFVTVLMAFITIFTLGLPFFFAYEMWAEPAYWKNRWKLHRLLNQGRVKVVYVKSNSFSGDNIKMYELTIDNIKYSVWIWENRMTLDYPNYKNDDFIGLFAGCITTKWLNYIAVKKIKQLAEHNL